MKSDLNIRTLLNGDVVRLRYVKRFSTCRLTAPESVAEHTYFTSLYALLIARWVVNNRRVRGIHSRAELPNSFYGIVLQKALLHDVEESRTGDLPRPFKHSSDSVKKAVDQAAGNFMLGTLEEMVGDRSQESGDLFAIWKHAKNTDVEGRIVEFADFLSAASYIVQEIEGNNGTMREHAKTMEAYAALFDAAEYDFLRPLVEQAQAYVKEVMLEA